MILGEMQTSRVGLMVLVISVILALTLAFMPYRTSCGLAISEAFRSHARALFSITLVRNPCQVPGQQRLWMSGAAVAVGLTAFVLLRVRSDSN